MSLHRPTTPEEFAHRVAEELTSEDVPPFPGDWAACLRSVLEWRARGDDLEEAQAKLDSAEEKHDEAIAALEADHKEEIEALENRLLDAFEGDPPDPAEITVAAREAVKTLRALLADLDAPKFTAPDRKRVRLAVLRATDALHAATLKPADKDDTQPEDTAPPAPPTWQTAEHQAAPFEWQRESLMARAGEVVRLRWTDGDLRVEATIERHDTGEGTAALQVWEDGRELEADDLYPDDLAGLLAHAETLEGALPART